MNQGCHRIVFNVRRGQLMAVAETTRCRSKAAAGEGSGHPRIWGAALNLAAAAVLLLPWAEPSAQIVAYRNAPGSQRPTVLSTGNGVPQVNIQTPSAAGVSRNTYSQFDIQENGAILNNSRTGANTQLAGRVSGNPWLAKGTAKVILNEVVSGNPSQLRGIIEVAGDRAEVVIANPAGVDVDGSGFINASRATITTGTPTVTNGNLEGYAVRQGTVTIKGGGLDASQTDYAAIIARAVQVNGAIHAKELKVVTGANQVSADHKQITPIQGTGQAPAFALDVSALGGMYAGKITMIGTEAGVGVRNAGTIAASSGEVVITADGRLVNTGQIISYADADVNANGGVSNSGTLYSRGSIRIATRRNIDNTGLIGAQSNASLNASGDDSEIRSLAGSILVAGLKPDGTLTSEGTLTLTAGQRLQANGTNRAGQSIEATSPSIGIWGSNTSAPNIRLDAMPSPRRPRSSRRYGANSISSSGDIDASGATITAEDEFEATTSGVLRTDGARIAAGRVDLQAHDLSNRGGQIYQTGNSSLSLDFEGYIDNTHGVLYGASNIGLNTGRLSNDGGNIQSVGRLTVHVDGHLDNGAGTLAGGGGVDVDAYSASNRGIIAGNLSTQGDLENAGAISGSASAGGDLDNSGQIVGSASANDIANSGSIGGHAVARGGIDNAGIIGGNATADKNIVNSGFIGGDAVATNVRNDGAIAGSAAAHGDIDNGGIIGGWATAEGMIRNDGLIGGSALAVGHLRNTGLIGGDALAGGYLTNDGAIGGSAVADGRIVNSGNIGGDALGGGDVENQGSIGGSTLAGGRLENSGRIGGSVLVGEHLINSGAIGGSAQAGDKLLNRGYIAGNARAGGDLSNGGDIDGFAYAEGNLGNGGEIGGSASARGDLFNSGFVGAGAGANGRLENTGTVGGSATSAESITNSGDIGGSARADSDLENTGTIGSRDYGVTVIADHVANTGTIGNDNAHVAVIADEFDNDEGRLLGNYVDVVAGQVSNVGGQIQANHTLLVAGRSTVDNTNGSISANGMLAVIDGSDHRTAAEKSLAIVNTNGHLAAGSRLVIDSASLSFDGTVTSGGDFSSALVGDYDRRTTGDFFQAQGNVSLSFTGNVTNDTHWHVAGGLQVTGSQVRNSGDISSNGITLVQATDGTLSNQGLIHGDQVFTLGVDLDNHGGQITGNSYYAAFSGDADNTGGRIDIGGSARISVAGDVNNTAGRIDAGTMELRVGGDLVNQTQAATAADGRYYEWSSDGLTMGTRSQQASGPRAGITARSGDMDLEVGGNLYVTGADLTATGSFHGLVLGDIHVTGLSLESQDSSFAITSTWSGDSVFYGQKSSKETASEHQSSSLGAGGDFSLIAGGNAEYQGVDIAAGGNLTLGAVTGNLKVEAQVDTASSSFTTVDAFGDRVTLDTSTQVAVGGGLEAGGDIRLLAGNDLHLSGVDATSGTGNIATVAGHDLDAGSLAVTSTENYVHASPPPMGDEFNPWPTPDRESRDTSATHQYGGDFTARGDVVFDAGHGNPFGTAFVAEVRAARVAGGMTADAQVAAATPGNLDLTGVNITAGKVTDWGAISIAAAGDVHVGGAWDSNVTEVERTDSYLALLGINHGVEESGTTVGVGPASGQLRGGAVSIRAEGGDLDLAALDVGSSNLYTYSSGDTRVSSSRLAASWKLGMRAEGQLSVDGLVADPSTAPAMAETLNGHPVPTSAQTLLSAGRDMSLTGVEGLSISGARINGNDITLSTLGKLTITGGNLHEEWAGRRDDHVRDTAVATTIDANSLTLQALGEKSDVDLAHVEVTTPGATRILATGDVNVDPGADYSYDHWTTKSSSGFLIEKTTATNHVRESLTIQPSRFTVGSFQLQSGGDVSFTATTLHSTGAVSLQAAGDIFYLAAHDQTYSRDESHTSYGVLGVSYKSSSDRHTEAHSTAFVTEMQTSGDVFSYSEGSTTLEGTRITSGSGQITVLAKADLNVLTASNSSFVEDVHESSSLFSTNGDITFNHKMKDTASTTTESMVGADIRGNTVLLGAGGDAHLVGASVSGTKGAAVMAGGNVLIEAGYDTQVSVHEHQESAWGLSFSSRIGRASNLGNIDQTHEANVLVASPVASRISSSQGDVALSAGGGLAILGSDVSAAGNAVLSGAQGVVVGGATTIHQSHVRDEESGSWLNTSEGYQDDMQLSGLSPSNLSAGGQVIFQSDTSVALGAVNVSSGGQTVFQTPKVDFIGEKTSSYVSHTDWDSDFMYAINAGHGHVEESLSLAHFDAKGGIVIPASTDVSVQLDGGLASLSTAELQSLARDLGTQPGLEWLRGLADSPEVDWQALQTAHQHWDYRTAGLTEAGAFIVSVAVAMVAGPAIGEALAGVAQTTAATIITDGLVAGTITTTAEAVAIQATASTVATVATAGLTSLASQASVSLINNGGNLSKTLHDLGSSSSVRNIVASMLTAGATNAPVFEGGASLNDLAGIKDIPGTGGRLATFNWDSFSGNLWAMGGRAFVNASVNSLVFDDANFRDAFVNSFVSDLAATGANFIGDKFPAGSWNNIGSHAVLGCAAGIATDKDCASGAVGGAFSAFATPYLDQWTDIEDPQWRTLALTSFSITGSAIVADALGLDDTTAMTAAQNEVLNNYLSHDENEARREAARKCEAGDAEACATRDYWDVVDWQRNRDFNTACLGQPNSAACQDATGKMFTSLSSYFLPESLPQPGTNSWSGDELSLWLYGYSDKSELQSYVELLKVSDPEVSQHSADPDRPSQSPTYSSDPYGVINADRPNTYVIVKVGDHWGAVGSTTGIFTDLAAVNGIRNDPDYAPGLLGRHVEKNFGDSSLYTLYYNPTEGIVLDGLETLMDKFGFTTSVTQQFSEVLAGVQANGKPVTWVVHSQGGVIYTEAVRYNGGNLSMNSVIFQAGANNQWVTNDILQNANINQKPNQKTAYHDSPFDLVPNVIGLNGNPVTIVTSILAAPFLFMGPEWSPHTLPYRPRPSIDWPNLEPGP